MKLEYIIASLAAVVAASSILVAYQLQMTIASLHEELDRLSRELEELRGKLREYNLTRMGASGLEARAIVYILPSEACTSYWKEKYGDRIYFYVHADLEDYRDLIGGDFDRIRKFYDSVIIVIPADDTRRFYRNLEIVDDIASRRGLRILWAIFPKWKYGAEEDYLEPGTAMNKLVLDLMQHLSKMNSTWKIAVWYGWKGRTNPDDILEFYERLPRDLKGLYSAWIDQPFISVVDGLAARDPPFLVVTELYSYEAIKRYSGVLRNQMVITGFHGAPNPDKWLEVICGKLLLIRGARGIGIWMYFDRGDGSGEDYAAYFPELGMANPWECFEVGG